MALAGRPRAWRPRMWVPQGSAPAPLVPSTAGLDAAWARAREALDGAPTGERARLGKLAPFRAVVDGVTLVLKSFGALLSGAGRPVVTIDAEVAAAAALRLRLRHGHVYPIGRALGIQDLIVGDAAFDDVFVVKGNALDLVRAWLDAPARQALLGASDYGFFVERGRAGAGFEYPDDRAERIVAAARAVAALASRPARIGAAWSELARGLGGRLGGGEAWGLGGAQTIIAPVRDLEVRIDAVFEGPGGRRRGARLVTRASATRTGGRGDAWVIAPADVPRRRDRRGLARVEHAALAAIGLHAHAAAPDRLGPRLDAQTIAQLALAAPAAVVADAAGVTAEIPGLLDRGDVGRAAALVQAVAALAFEVEAQHGPYR